MSQAEKLREVFERETIVVIPGAYDVYSALLIQEVGFQAAYLGGFSISASAIGHPDWGFSTMTEMLSVSINAVAALDIPVICDIDQGFGALTNFVRTVHCYEKAGVAAIHFEDQPFPKKCSQQPDRAIISENEAVKKIKAAVETRSDPNFMLIARTDSKEVEGMDGLKRRINSYLEAGADYCIFCEQTTEEELIEVGRVFPGKVIAFVGDAADNPACCLPVSAYEEMGYKGVMYCGFGLCSAHFQVKRNYENLYNRRHISSGYLKENAASLDEVQRTTNISRWQKLRDKYDML